MADDNDDMKQALDAAAGMLGGGDKAPTTVEVEHLDYEYIGQCNDGTHMEKIYAVLKSGKEGVYPDLQEFARKKLMELKPDSVLLRVTVPVSTMRDLEKDDRKRLTEDFKAWASDMKAADETVAKAGGPTALPPIRGQKAAASAAPRPPAPAPAAAKQPKKMSEAIAKGDFAAWDRYEKNLDGELEAAEIGSGKVTAERSVINSGPAHFPPATVPNIPVDPTARRRLALQEKEKGNESYRAGDLDEAAVYYSRSMSVEPMVATRNNRSLVYLKLQKFRAALDDASAVLATEPCNVKALVRKASAHVGIGDKLEAYLAAKKALAQQPSNKEAKRIVSECASAVGAPKKKRMVIEDVGGDDDSDAAGNVAPKPAATPAPTRGANPQSRRVVIEEDSEDSDDDGDGGEPTAAAAPSSAAGSADPPQPQAKRIVIEEDDEDSDSDEDDEEGGGNVPGAAGAGAPVAAPEDPPPPAAVLRLKEVGNDAFKAGQYGKAVEEYTRALKALRTEEVHNREMEATLFSNRAACHLKDGSCRAAIADCTEGLKLRTSSTGKLLLRRGAAHEACERYADGYADYQAAFRVLENASLAQQGANRCATVLRHEHGSSWRKVVDKLPPRPTAAAGAPIAVKPTEAPLAAAAAVAAVPPIVEPATEQPDAAEIPTTESVDEYLVYKNRGNDLTKTKDFEGAIKCYDRCVEINPAEAAAFNNRALCHLRLGNWSSATRDASAVLAMDPTNAKAMIRKAKGLAGLAQFEAAAEIAEECRRIHPQNKGCIELLTSVKAEVAKRAALVDRDPALAALNEKRLQLEKERREAEAALNDVQSRVASVQATVGDLSATLNEKNIKLEEANKTIVESAGDVAADILKQAEAEGDAQLVAEAAAAKKRVDEALATKKKKEVAAEKKAVSKHESKAAAAAAAATAIKKWSPADFMKQLVRKRKDPPSLCTMLLTVDGRQLPKLFSNRLEAEDITAVFTAVRLCEDPKHAFCLLSGLVKTKRFDMVAMFLEEKDWEVANPVFDRIKAAAAGGIDGGPSVADVETLRAQFP